MRKLILIAALMAGSAAGSPAFAQMAEEGISPAQQRLEDADRGRGGSEQRRGGWQARPAPDAGTPRGDGAGRADIGRRGESDGQRGERPVGVAPGGEGGWRRREAPPVVQAVPAAPPVFQSAPPQRRDWRGAPPVIREGDGVARGRDPQRRDDGARDWRRRDRDGDGVANRRDWDRDGDGVANRRDWDRNNDGRVDGRWDRNRDGAVDRRYDWNRDGRRDERRYGGWDDNRRPGYSVWNRDWRSDRRYDWQDWRYQNRNVFRLPRYTSPYGRGYGYRRFGVGIYLDGLFYSSRYWLDDPWAYRLPEARWPFRWVRYYGDVLLVDTRNGYVVDVIHDFFW